MMCLKRFTPRIHYFENPFTMSFQKSIFLLVGVVLIISMFQLGGVQGVRLCGKRLADLLNFICERHGGFHAPGDSRSASNALLHKRAVIEIYRPLVRRTDPEVTNEAVEGTVDEGTSHFQQGIVDECCKKQCTLSTLTSYCANAQQVGDIDLEEMLPSGTFDEPTLTDEELTELEYQRVISGSSAFGEDTDALENPSDSNRPNLGLSNRNRPVFIVLPQTQEEI